MTSGESTYTIELPYRRSLGPVVSAFLTGLRDGRVVGSRTAAGRVLVPPLEYDPDNGQAVDELVDVADVGTVKQWTWIAEPLRKHPLDRPFAWALIQLDGADSSLLHALDTGSPEQVTTGMRVQARWKAERQGHITDIECFEPEGVERAPVERAPADAERILFMQQPIALDYSFRTSPTAEHFGEQMVAGRITGHRCPSCNRVYVPPKGFCPICVVATTDDNEVDVADKGIITSWTVITPIQYHGQKERDDYALASVLLDGADGTIGQQRVLEVPLDKIRMGMRVEAVWAPEAERDGGSDRGWGFGNAIQGWRPTGEPDADRSHYEEHVL